MTLGCSVHFYVDSEVVEVGGVQLHDYEVDGGTSCQSS
jgi:hypothetical protein